jgi:type I restriction enzyme R subunit
LKKAAQEKSLMEITNGLLDVADPDKQMEKAREMFNVETPTDDQIEQAAENLATEACRVFDDPDFRKILIENRKQQ